MPGITTKTILAAAFLLAAFPSQPEKPGSLPKPKNIIILIGDGMGYNHVLAAEYYLGTPYRLQGRFPVRLAMSHYPALAGEYDTTEAGSNHYASGYDPSLAWKDTAWLKRNFTESAAAATALATGVKTYNNSIGMSVDHEPLENLVQRAKSVGKAAGVVTSVPFAHATPAGFTAHNVSRINYSRIAAEMLLESRCDVIMGCGNPVFDNSGNRLSGKWNGAKYVVDSAFWQQLIAGSGRQIHFMLEGRTVTVADNDGDKRPDPWTVIEKREDFLKLSKGKTPDRVLGCPEVYSTLQEARTAVTGETNESPPWFTPPLEKVPSLAEMTAGALNVLDNNSRGFFLMVEGGAPDWASHSNGKGRLVEEMTGFFGAIDEVFGWVEKNSNWKETLLIVTGDHETGLLWGDKPFVPMKDNGKGNLPGMTFYSRDHTNSLIPFYAIGTGSELFPMMADERDSVRGAFIQNSEVAQVIKLLWFK